MSDLIKDPDPEQISKLSGQDPIHAIGCNKAKEMDLYNAEKFVVPAREKGTIEKEHMGIFFIFNNGDNDM